MNSVKKLNETTQMNRREYYEIMRLDDSNKISLDYIFLTH